MLRQAILDGGTARRRRDPSSFRAQDVGAHAPERFQIRLQDVRDSALRAGVALLARAFRSGVRGPAPGRTGGRVGDTGGIPAQQRAQGVVLRIGRIRQAVRVHDILAPHSGAHGHRFHVPSADGRPVRRHAHAARQSGGGDRAIEDRDGIPGRAHAG